MTGSAQTEGRNSEETCREEKKRDGGGKKGGKESNLGQITTKYVWKMENKKIMLR